MELTKVSVKEGILKIYLMDLMKVKTVYKNADALTRLPQLSGC